MRCRGDMHAALRPSSAVKASIIIWFRQIKMNNRSDCMRQKALSCAPQAILVNVRKGRCNDARSKPRKLHLLAWAQNVVTPRVKHRVHGVIGSGAVSFDQRVLRGGSFLNEHRRVHFWQPLIASPEYRSRRSEIML